jgi:site-specific recombinase XerD
MPASLDHIDPWLEHLRARSEPAPVARRTVVEYRSKVRQCAAWLGDRDPTPQLLREYVHYLQFEHPHPRGTGLKPATIKACLLPVLEYLAWSRETHGAACPALAALPEGLRVKRPPIPKRKPPAPEREVIGRLFQTALAWPTFTLPQRFERARALAILALASDCALRRQEIVGMDLVHLRTREEPWVVEVHHGKGDKYREVDVNAHGRRLLIHYLDVRAAWCAAAAGRIPHPALFPVDARRRINRDTVTRVRWRLLEEAGMPRRWSLHSLRAFRLTEWLSVNGVDPETVAELAGHSDVATTWRYCRASAERRRQAIEGSYGGTALTEDLEAVPSLRAQSEAAGLNGHGLYSVRGTT